MTSHTVERVAWWDGEDVVRLSCVPRHMPEHHDGRPVNVRAVYRWAQQGVGGVLLRRFRVGGSWCTTRQEIVRWQAALTTCSGG